MILADSSVWIDYFNGRATGETNFLDAKLGIDPILTGDLILAEVLQGFRHEKDFKIAKKLLGGLEMRVLCGRDIALRAAQHFRLLRSKLNQSRLANRRSAAFRSGRIQALRELLENRLQKRLAAPGASQGRIQSCKIDRGSQLPRACSLTAAQFKRAPEAHFRVAGTWLRRRQKKASLHSQ